MPNYWPLSSGNWSNLSNWLTANTVPFNAAILPTSADDVYANNRIIYIDGNYRVNSVINLSAVNVTAGGYFILNNNSSLSANVMGGGSDQLACVYFVSAFPATATLTGSICAVNAVINSPIAIQNSGTGTLTVYGSSIRCIKSANSSTSFGYIMNSGGGTLNLIGTFNGNIFGVTTNSYNFINNIGTNSVVNIFGNCLPCDIGTGGSGNISNNGSNCTMNIVGDVAGGGGSATNNNLLYNFATNTLNITGNVYSSIGSSAHRAIQTQAGTCRIVGNVYAGLWSNFGTGGPSPGGTAPPYAILNTGAVTVIGGVSGGYGPSAGNQGHGIVNNSPTATINVIGTVFCSTAGGGNNVGNGIANANEVGSGSGTVTVSGVVIGGNSGSGITNSTGTVSVTGNIITIGNGNGITNSGAGTVTIIGGVTGCPLVSNTGVGVSNTSTGTVIIRGTATGGAGGNGAVNSSTGIMRVQRVVGGPAGLQNASTQTFGGVNSNVLGQFFAEEFEYGPFGMSPMSGPVFITPTVNSVTVMETEPLAYETVTLFSSLSASSLLPPASSVRFGTVYGNGDFTGTMIVPSFSAVQVGVPVDNTVGIFVLSPESFWQFPRNSGLDRTSIGYRIANLATIASVGQQIASFNLSPPMSTFNIL